MTRLKILSILLAICCVAACTSNQPEVEVAPAETIETRAPTQEQVQPSATIVPKATSRLTLEITDTPEKTDSPTDIPVGEPVEISNREVVETLVLKYNPNETNFIYMETSPDVYRLAYTRFTDQGQYVVLGEEKQGPYDEIELLSFSPDSQHIVYVAKLGDKKFVVLDGIEQTYYDDIFTSVIFSPDSQRIAYVAKKDKKLIAVIDGSEFIYDNIQRGIRLSPDGQRFAFVARDLNANAFVVLDGNEGKKYDDIEIYNLDLYFSPDSQHLAYLAKKGDDWFVVLDGEKGFPFRESYPDLVFSPDSQHFAYHAKIGEQVVIILDGQILDNKFEASYNPVFSPDSQRLAYIASLNEERFFVVDGTEDPAYEGFIHGLTFSPNSQRYAYRIETDDKYVMVIDGVIQEGHNVRSSPVFSPNSQHIAYMTFDGDSYYLVLDGKEIEDYDSISNINFSPDSNHILFIAQDDDTWIEYIVLDGIGGKKYDDIISPIIFDAEYSFHYIAILEDEVYLVEENIN